MVRTDASELINIYIYIYIHVYIRVAWPFFIGAIYYSVCAVYRGNDDGVMRVIIACPAAVAASCPVR